MKPNNILKAGLLGSASALGVNWIYDRELLKDLAKKEKMIFRKIDHELYKEAKTSFDVYPNHQVGMLDYMGEVLYLFHMFFSYDKDKTVQRWRDVFYEYFREDYEYDGYIESYGKDFLSQYKKEKEGNLEPVHQTDHIDKQLVGLIFMIALFENNLSIDKYNDAMRFAKTLTAYENIGPLNRMIFELLKRYFMKKTKR